MNLANLAEIFATADFNFLFEFSWVKASFGNKTVEMLEILWFFKTVKKITTTIPKFRPVKKE